MNSSTVLHWIVAANLLLSFSADAQGDPAKHESFLWTAFGSPQS
jgi:hypothetical protein